MNPFQPLPQHQRAVTRWLTVCALLVALMVFIGGVTRLTESGLSIVEWKLVSGTLPPMTDAAWQQEFDAYKLTPQYEKVNRDFTVADFKGIFWLEYLHRLLGRIIGMAVALPLAYFAARRMLPRRLLLRGVAMAVLVGAQGTVGWIMVASGLDHEPRVEPLKLATHLLLAFSVFGLILWTRWQVLDAPRFTAPRSLAIGARALLAILVLQIFFGALVAGLRAGLSYTTYPLMDGQFIPEGLHLMSPWWINHLESVLTVQFQHRMGAILVAGAALAFAIKTLKFSEMRFVGVHMAGAVLCQFALGVATLLSGVNLWLASAHQMVALLLVASVVRAIYRLPLTGVAASA